jgi:DNA-binding winged helix-turn-helix (wHTH) protein/tetratricopeptide (TPR) repeat protein
MGRSRRFGTFTLDLERLCLRGPAGRAELRPKSFEVLRYLVEHAGRVVTKDEMIDAVWPDVTVTDDSLTRCISDARRALGDRNQRIIKTVPRRGYLFDMAVSSGDGQQVTAARPLPVSNVPIRVPRHFMGRDEELAAIAAAFGGGNGSLAVAITALHGLRGVGKTTLAAAYAERHRRSGGSAWWIRAHEEASLRADLVGLGIRLGWVDKDEREDPALAAVMDRLRHESDGSLLIFDNAVDPGALKHYLPLGGAARVLITSNSPAWRGIAAPIRIEVWPKTTGAGFLTARSGRTDETLEAEALSEALGGLPLAHEQAAAYCERLNISPGEYLKRFTAAPARFLDDVRHTPAEYGGLTVAKTFSLAIDEAARLHPAAEPLIVHAAMLAPDPIPLFLFAEACETFDEPLRSALAGNGLDEAVGALRTFALLDREAITDECDASLTTEAIRLHRLVREIAARRADERGGRMRRSLSEALTAVYPGDGFRNAASWPRCAPLTPHVLSICGMETADATGQAQHAELLGRAGRYLRGRAAYAAALPLFERALAICERALGPEHPRTATGLDYVAYLLADQGDVAAAWPLHERALAIREKVFGPRHPDTATSLSNLADRLLDRGDYAGARPLYERVLAIREKALGREHPDTATGLTGLALVFFYQRNFAGAEPLFRRALAICQKAFGPEHRLTATSLQNLALTLVEHGDLAGARAFQERALAIREKVLGPAHPATAHSLAALAWMLRKTGDARETEARFKRAIAIGEKTLGPEHAWTQGSCCYYAEFLLDMGRAAESLSLAEGALAVHEADSGAGSRWTRMSARTLAGALAALGRGGEAAALRLRYDIGREANDVVARDAREER